MSGSIIDLEQFRRISEDDEDPLGTTELTFKFDMDLVPRWTNLVERICLHHCERYQTFVDPQGYVIKLRIINENKPGFINDVNNFWRDYVKQEKQAGRWKR